MPDSNSLNDKVVEPSEEDHPLGVRDCIQFQDFDYIDMGKELRESHVVSVAIKSVVFGG